jgi:hypothetical protein
LQIPKNMPEKPQVTQIKILLVRKKIRVEYDA